MNIDKSLTGTLIISDVINGYRVQQKYIGYTLTEAKKLFKAKFKHLKYLTPNQ